VVIDESVILNLNIGGRGGKEASLLPLFPDYKRVSAPLYDFVSSKDSKDRIETKKQANCQWFDVGKYHNLSEEDKNISMMFLVHDKGAIKHIFRVSLGDMLDILCSDSEHQKSGWTFDNVQQCSILKNKYPSMQVKVKLNVKSFYKKYKKQLETLYIAS
jgi:hypothetical protein